MYVQGLWWIEAATGAQSVQYCAGTVVNWSWHGCSECSILCRYCGELKLARVLRVLNTVQVLWGIEAGTGAQTAQYCAGTVVNWSWHGCSECSILWRYCGELKLARVLRMLNTVQVLWWIEAGTGAQNAQYCAGTVVNWSWHGCSECSILWKYCGELKLARVLRVFNTVQVLWWIEAGTGAQSAQYCAGTVVNWSWHGCSECSILCRYCGELKLARVLRVLNTVQVLWWIEAGTGAQSVQYCAGTVVNWSWHGCSECSILWRYCGELKLVRVLRMLNTVKVLWWIEAGTGAQSAQYCEGTVVNWSWHGCSECSILWRYCGELKLARVLRVLNTVKVLWWIEAGTGAQSAQYCAGTVVNWSWHGCSECSILCRYCGELKLARVLRVLNTVQVLWWIEVGTGAPGVQYCAGTVVNWSWHGCSECSILWRYCGELKLVRVLRVLNTVKVLWWIEVARVLRVLNTVKVLWWIEAGTGAQSAQYCAGTVVNWSWHGCSECSILWRYCGELKLARVLRVLNTVKVLWWIEAGTGAQSAQYCEGTVVNWSWHGCSECSILCRYCGELKLARVLRVLNTVQVLWWIEAGTGAQSVQYCAGTVVNWSWHGCSECFNTVQVLWWIEAGTGALSAQYCEGTVVNWKLARVLRVLNTVQVLWWIKTGTGAQSAQYCAGTVVNWSWHGCSECSILCRYCGELKLARVLRVLQYCAGTVVNWSWHGCSECSIL